ncbi:hypothetical protein OHS59_33185 [Streptomyces sp. NBC_00414]
MTTPEFTHVHASDPVRFAGPGRVFAALLTHVTSLDLLARACSR